MLDYPQTEQYTPLVARYLKINDVTRGDEKQGYLVRYRGRLYGDSAEAYDQLSEMLRPSKITPLFRQENDQHVILLVDSMANPRPSNPWINVILFIATVFSVIFAGAMYTYDGPSANNFWGDLLIILQNMRLGIPFAIALLSILLAHEFGHYLMGRFHKTHVTLPYFIPLPISPLGTMGAAIQLKELPKNKRILLDIGIAGPIAGLVVAIPVLLYGLSISHVSQIAMVPGGSFQIEGNSILYLLSKYIIFHQWLPSPSSYGDLSPFVYWLRYFFTGKPLPVGGLDVMISPIAWAGWAGLLVTALNLIPAGQLDGGHLLYSWIGKRARMLWPFILAALLVLGFFWSGWWLWAVLIFLLGRLFADPLDQITELNPGRKAVAILGLVLFLLVFTPVPLTIQMF
jgi:membrane-associated protease RseP (regulator of RpoE activity)